METVSAPELFPTPSLLSLYKKGGLKHEEYKYIYTKEVLSILSPAEIYSKYNKSLFLCYEKNGEFCHRHLVSDWLNKNGGDAEELSPQEIKIAVVGSRSFMDFEYAEKVLLALVKNYPKCSFVSGGALGADTIIKLFCEKYDYSLLEILPEWSKYGKKAGFLRNYDIWQSSDIGLCFWDGKSKGTAHSFKISKDMNKKCYVVEYLSKNIYLSR